MYNSAHAGLFRLGPYTFNRLGIESLGELKRYIVMVAPAAALSCSSRTFLGAELSARVPRIRILIEVPQRRRV